MKNFSFNDKIDERFAISLLKEDWYHEYSLLYPDKYYYDQKEGINTKNLFLVGKITDIFSLLDSNLKLALTYDYILPRKKDGSLIKNLRKIEYFIYEYPNEGFDSDFYVFDIQQAEHFKIIQADNSDDFNVKILSLLREKVYCNAKFITYINKDFLINIQTRKYYSEYFENVYFPDNVLVKAENISALLRHIYFGYKNKAYLTTIKIDNIEYKKVSNAFTNKSQDEYMVTKRYRIQGTNVTIETKINVLIKNQRYIIINESSKPEKFKLSNDILIYKDNNPISLDELLTNALQVRNSDGDHILEPISLNDIDKHLIINLVKNNITNFTDYIAY